MTRLRTMITLACVTALLLTTSADAGQGAAGLAIGVDRPVISTSLGGRFAVRTTLTNHDTRDVLDVIAHLNVVSLRDGVYVDPEDWSSRRTVYLASIRASTTRTIAWRLQAVNPGSFAVYVAVVPAQGTEPATLGPVTHVEVAGKKTLDAGGILPLALGVPLTLAGLALVVRRRRRRR